MTFSEFLIKWNGKYIDFDGVYGAQCMDLMHQFNVEVSGLTDGRILAAPSAKDVYNNFDNLFGHEYFDRIGNTPEGVPKEGDLIVWGSGLYGHIAVFVEGDTNSFRSYDQNYPTDSPCHIQNHTYNNVLGWLRFKGQQGTMVGQEIIQNSDTLLAFLEHSGLPNNKDIIFAEWDKYVGYEDLVREKESQLQELQQKALDLENRLLTINKELNALGANYAASQTALSELKVTVKTLQEENTELKKVKPLDEITWLEHIRIGIKKFLGI